MIERWLALLCSLLPGVVGAVVIRRDGSLWARWPEAADVQALQEFTASAKADEVRYGEAPAERTRIALPLHNGKLRVGTIGLELPLKRDQRATTELLLRWSQAWLDLLSDTHRDSQRGLEKVLRVVEQGGRFSSVTDNAAALATSLAEQMGLARVVVCLHWRGRFRVAGVSGAPNFDHRSEMFSLLEKDLNTSAQALDDIPADSEYRRWLVTRNPPLAMHVLPLLDAGYLILMYEQEQSPGSAAKAQCRQIARVIAPLWQSQNRARQSFYWSVRTSVKNRYKNLQQRNKWAVMAALGFCLLVFLCLPGTHRVRAPAALEGKVQRAIVVPEDGYLQEADVKAGEVIRQGQVLAQLDNKSLQLEVQRWQAEKQEYERQYNRELTALNPVEMRIAKAKIAQADAQLNLYRERLQRVRIIAPIDGVIIKGDLSRAIGSPVQRGQVLYEIAPLDAFKLVIQVPQKSIRHLQQGQSGNLILSALPHDNIPFAVTAVASVYSEHEQDIVYRVEADIIGTWQNLRPGMSGYAKITAGKKPYAWLIAHPLWDWLALKFWWL